MGSTIGKSWTVIFVSDILSSVRSYVVSVTVIQSDRKYWSTISS